MLKSKFSRCLFALFAVAAMNLAACGDDDDFVARPGDDEPSSSSVKGKSSSSGAKSSSSVTEAQYSSSLNKVVPACKSVKDGSMVDERDGQEYRTVDICGQVWMAENLNYKTEYGSYCYEKKQDNCDTYGRLYQWSVIMDSAGVFSDDALGCGTEAEECSPSYPVRGICPEGWHVPTIHELESLLKAVGSIRDESRTWEWLNAGKILKSATEDWVDDGMGEDSYGFTALPAGSGARGSYFTSLGKLADIATSSIDMDLDYHTYCLNLREDEDDGIIMSDLMRETRSVRCVKN